ncbi:altronate hydrolase [Cohaesibacter sp. ES.047]|uniref:UxaA family hydrolase n=1 Tax=Cohaesibacter sp. ES.047 TaxID=1798205 RepID=UPI000BB6905C|nr:UxaA family hydrolase [Cohaesibacter sp. ES.047]SNY90269.1 altronate hydrolase [Cohaesibacter sp. ES.047]
MNDPFERSWTGYLRKDGRKGIRNLVLVVHTVMCSRHVAHAIAQGEDDVHVIGFDGCYDNQYAIRLLLSLARHPNVGAVLAVGLGCEYTQPGKIAELARESGRLAEAFYIQDTGGTQSSIDKGKAIVRSLRSQIKDQTPRVEMSLKDMTIGAECGGSDGTSGLAGNPVTGRFFDFLVDAGGRAIIEEIVEMVGLKEIILDRAATAETKTQLDWAYNKAVSYCQSVRQYSVSPGNFAGGLTTIEEKSMGAFAKSGSRPIQGVIKVGTPPPDSGLWIMDSVPDEHFMNFGYTNPNDTEGLVDLMSAGSQLLVFVTGRGSVIGSAISPLLKVTGNSETYNRLKEDMDFDAGRILTGDISLDDAAIELAHLICDIASGQQSKPEALGHAEYYIMYKHQNADQQGGCRL